jgi:hypothetical protein
MEGVEGEGGSHRSVFLVERALSASRQCGRLTSSNSCQFGFYFRVHKALRLQTASENRERG